MGRYLREIEDLTRAKFKRDLIRQLKETLQKQKRSLVPKREGTRHKRIWKDYAKFQARVRAERQNQTGQKWPDLHTEPVVAKRRTVIKKGGDFYDAHPIIEQSYGGSHEWWNLVPARRDDIHQGSIHGGDGVIHGLMPQRNIRAAAKVD